MRRSEMTRSYQNAYGAKGTGEQDTWDKGAATVSISEGPGYGPMQDCAESQSVFAIELTGEGAPAQAKSRWILGSGRFPVFVRSPSAFAQDWGTQCGAPVVAFSAGEKGFGEPYL